MERERDPQGKSLATSPRSLWLEVSRCHFCTWSKDQQTDDTDGSKCVCLDSGCLSGREPEPDPWWSTHLAVQPTSQLPFLLSCFQSVIYLNAAEGPCRGQLDKQAWPDVSVCPQASTVVRKLSGVSPVRSLIPFIEAPPSWPLQSSTSWRHHTGNQDSTVKVGKDTNIQFIAPGILQNMLEGANPVEIKLKGEQGMGVTFS